MTEPTATSAVLLTAGVLGVTHGIEPDHAAGIASLTARNGSSKLSAIVGMCFAAGHVLLVVLWTGTAYLLFESVSSSGPLELLATILPGTTLVFMGGLITVVGVRSLVSGHGREHESGEKEPSHFHFHLHIPFSDRDPIPEATAYPHEHTIGEYLKMSFVGALFAISPPLSMIAFVSVIVSNTGTADVVSAVLVYAVAIGFTMSLIGGGIGTFFAVTKRRSERIQATVQAVSGVSILAFGCYLVWQALPSLVSLP